MTAKFEYSVGEMVRIKTGAFQSFTGRIKEVDESAATLKVVVKISAALSRLNWDSSMLRR
jgi:transcription antitermination factor NusG